MTKALAMRLQDQDWNRLCFGDNLGILRDENRELISST
jgi:hypothetical protein